MTAAPKQKRGRPRQALPDVSKPNDFALWIQSKNLDIEAIAHLLDVSESVVYGWRKGTRTPSLGYAIRISEVSNGAVSAESWKKKKKVARVQKS